MKEVIKNLRKCFHNKHAVIIFLRLFHIVGLISLPDFYKDAWKNKVHNVYSNIVYIFLFTNIISTLVAYLKFSITDTAECCERLLEVSILVYLVAQAYHFKFNLGRVLQMNEFFEVTWRNQPTVDVIHSHARREMILVCPISILGFVTLVFVLLYPMLPETESQLKKIAAIYNFKYPQNTLPLFLYVPFVDTSEPKYYPWFYTFQVVLIIMGLMMGYISYMNFVLIPHNLKVLYDVLNHYAMALGRVHLNQRGVQVFYTNIRRGEYVEANFAGRGVRDFDRAAKDILYAQYEYFYLKKIVQFEQSLKILRRQIDNHIKYNYVGLVVLFLTGFCLSMYALLMPGLLSPLVRKKVLFVAALFSACCVITFHGGEYLASSSVSLKRSLLNSHWYKCSRKTQEIIPLIIQMNQTHKYLTVTMLAPCNYDTMVSILKTGYSGFNLLRRT